jgi:hypothetical protein
MFLRYNITSAADRVDALERTAAHLAIQPKTKEEGKVVEMPRAEAAGQ